MNAYSVEVLLSTALALVVWSAADQIKPAAKEKYNKDCVDCKKNKEHDHSGNGKLLPILDPLFNIREITKNIALQEEHMANKRKRCGDCCRKHFLIMEGLAEEAVSLDKDQKHTAILQDLPDKIRAIEKRYLSKENPLKIAQSLRALRKSLVPISYEHF